MNRSKSVKVAVGVMLALSVCFGLLRAGDVFLFYLGRELRIDISYKNHAGFISCFMLRSLRLKSPIFRPEDFDAAIECQTALIVPSFDRLIKDKTIALKCVLKNASVVGLEKKAAGADDLFALFQGNIMALFNELQSIVYSEVFMEMVLHEGSVHFKSFEAHSDNVKLRASGTIAETGDFDVKLKVYFSPEIAAKFPDNIGAILREESGGWLSYSMDVANGQDSSVFKLNSDRFIFDFERIETH
ncbi:MAG: hypothetical protein ABID09_05725 [Candidatus Omnitrophota bacterium]